MGSFYVTTPIYYVNAAPHLGHAYTTIAADVMARHQRQRGEDVFFLTGTDEHGEPVALAAEREGVTPQELADRNAERFRALMPQLDASNDFFIRTSDPQHKASGPGGAPARPRQRPRLQGRRTRAGTARAARTSRRRTRSRTATRCPIHHIELTREQEENWFFRLSAFQERARAALRATSPTSSCRATATTRRCAFIKGGLQDVSLSRAKLTLGRPRARGTTTHVFYVWFDALLNYYTALGYARDGEDLTDRFWPATTTSSARTS